MNTNKIKIGETYYVRVKADRNDVDGTWCLLIDESGKGNNVQKFYKWMLYAFSPAPTKPKYDPCRPFRVGDIVTPIERDGREVPDGAPVGEKCTVVESEKNGIVCIRYDAGSEHYIHEIPYFHLELVTPVEELEQLYINPIFDCDNGNPIGYEIAHADGLTEAIVYGGKGCFRTLAEAKEAAEDERDRLNAEYRKEQK